MSSGEVEINSDNQFLYYAEFIRFFLGRKVYVKSFYNKINPSLEFNVVHIDDNNLTLIIENQFDTVSVPLQYISIMGEQKAIFKDDVIRYCIRNLINPPALV